MKQKIQAKDIWLLVAQALLLSFIMLSPGLISYISSRDGGMVTQALWISAFWLGPMVGVYLLNFYLFIPLLWFRNRFWLFGIANVVLIILSNLHLISNDISNLPNYVQVGFSSFVMISFLLCLMAIGIALSIRYMMRRSERKQKEVEAELAWLKNQINPHFLFNTLNNISSLAQIDADETQEAIIQLSDLLRYAMYETNKPKVRLDGEVEFMRNYIDLMKLRCNEMTTVNSQFTIHNSQLEVAPLLFISLIENAFKHGVNSNAPATIDISLEQQDDMLVFNCDNTNNPKPTKDRSGSGIGLKNTRRRLDLLYPGRYTWEQAITPENIYHVKISIRL
ncbi:MAG: histidine kinase [Prevotella sp.]|nr:histidine kinase [Prevotella sp.]MBR0048901.1 histidine kinase [Prevotella sp.]